MEAFHLVAWHLAPVIIGVNGGVCLVKTFCEPQPGARIGNAIALAFFIVALWGVT